MTGFDGLTVALTRTLVATEPAETTVCTNPPTSLVTEVGVISMPPIVVFSEKSTVASGTGPPLESVTRKRTVDVSCRPMPPVPSRPILSGSALTNSIDPTVAGSTVNVATAVKTKPSTLAVAVTSSVPAQPVAE